METKVNYVLVGLFTLALGAALIAATLWLASGGQIRRTFDPYRAYLSESVAGLNINAPVKYRGVDVGRVTEIVLDPQDPERVRLSLNIRRGTPIKTDTVGLLRLQGLTGIAYLELTGGSRQAPLLAPPRPGEPPVIPTVPSLLTRLDAALTQLVSTFDRTAANVNAVLDADNQRAFKAMLTNLETLTAGLAAQRPVLAATLAQARRTAERTAAASARLPALTDRTEAALTAIEQAARQVNRVGESSQATLEDLRGLAGDLRELSAAVQRVTEQLERNPSLLLYGRQPPPLGPGEAP